ncbi:MAG: hypothetical protein AABX14_06010, partial [Candidatus Aenigmatarchaeota archaeon]
MKFLILAAVFSLFLLSPAFAAGNLNVTSTSLAPVYINTRTVTNMLNLTMNSTVGNTNITSLNVTIAGNITIANVSGVFLINATGSTIASSTSNSTTTKFTVSIPAGFNASSGANTSLIIAVNVSGLANPSSNVSLQLESSAAFAVDSSSNVTFSNFVNSTDSEIRDLHANASVSPNFVDTNAINQTITYSVVMTGHEKLNGTIITIPSGYSFVNISNVELEGANNTAIETVTTSPNYINVTLSITKSKIKVFFNVNTSNSRINSSAFATAISGGNLNNVTTDTVSPGVNVTTQQLINVTNVALAKGAAIVNGTDYWEFNFTLGFTANVTGLLQFKMSDWTDASSSVNRLNINTSSVYYATLR